MLDIVVEGFGTGVFPFSVILGFSSGVAESCQFGENGLILVLP
jgi:hypothetical protein